VAADHKLTKSIGEHFVCAILAHARWAGSLTRDGIARTDILAVNTDDRRMIEIQVKTSTTHARPSWPLGEVALAETAHEWYVLVALGASLRDRPRCFVVPRNHAAAGHWIGHYAWLTDPSVPPGTRNTTLQRGRADMQTWLGYEERWDLLGSVEVPIFLPAWMRNAMTLERVGLPPGHPWEACQPPETEWPGLPTPVAR
jgi:hypothetical protein